MYVQKLHLEKRRWGNFLLLAKAEFYAQNSRFLCVGCSTNDKMCFYCHPVRNSSVFVQKENLTQIVQHCHLQTVFFITGLRADNGSSRVCLSLPEAHENIYLVLRILHCS